MTTHAAPADLAAIADAAIDEPVEALRVPVAPGLDLELVVDGHGLLAASWSAGAWWSPAEIGEA